MDCKKAVKELHLPGNMFSFIQTEYALTKQEMTFHNLTCATVLIDLDVKRDNICCASMIETAEGKEGGACGTQIKKVLNAWDG